MINLDLRAQLCGDDQTDQQTMQVLSRITGVESPTCQSN